MADELKTVLGFDASQAISTLAKLQTQMAGYTISMTAAAGSTTGFNTAAKNVDATLGQLANAQRGLVSSQNNVIASSTKVKKGVKDTGDEVEDTADKTKKAGKQMMLSWQAVMRIFAIQVIHQMISKVTSALSESISEASDLEIALAEIQTISVPLRNDFESLAESVHSLSDEFGISRDIVAEGIYQTLSNQIADGADAFSFFAASSELAIGGVMSADAAVNLLSSTINAYGYNASQAATLSGKLFKTIELGRVRGEEFANTYGRILVVASQLGVAFDEVSASVATLTISGLRYNEAATLITNTMLKLIRPTDTLKKTMQEMGVESAEAGIQAFGFQGFLQKLRDAAGGSTQALGKMFGRVRAIRGVMGLTGEATERYIENLKEIEKAGAGDIFTAKELIFKTNAKQVEIELTALKNAIVFDFGRDALVAINEVFQAFGGAVNILKGLTVTIGAAALGMSIFAAITFPIAASILAVSVAVGVLAAKIASTYDDGVDKLKELRVQQRKDVEETKREAGELTELHVRELNKQFTALQKYAIQRKAAINDIIEYAKVKEEFLSGILDKQLDDRANAWDSFVDAIEQKIEDSATNIENSQQKIFDIQREIANFDFNQSIKGADALKKSAMANERSAQFIRAAGNAFRKGKADVAGEYLDEANAMARMALAAAESAKNRGAVYQAEKQVNSVFDARINLQKRFQEGERATGRMAQAQHNEEAARADRIGIALTKLQEIKIFGPKGIKFPTAEDAKAAAKPWVDTIEAEFAAMGAKKDIFERIGLGEQAAVALAPFRDLLTKEPVDLRFTVDQYIDETFNDVEAWFADNPVPMKVKLILDKLDLDFGTLQGLEQSAKDIVTLNAEAIKLLRTTSDATGNQEAYNNSVAAGRRYTKEFTTASKEVREELQEHARRISDYGGRETAVFKKTAQALIILSGAEEVVADSMVKLMDAVSGDELDLEKFTAATDTIKKEISILEGVHLGKVAAPVVAFAKEMDAAGKLLSEIEIETGLVKDIGTITEALKGTQQAVGPELTTAAASGASGVEAAAEREKVAAKEVATEWKITGVAIDSVVGAIGKTRPVTDRMFGKTTYHAGGGFVPRGTDRIPAMLSPFESIINADSTRQFFSQIVAMNAGKTPVYRNTGGTVTNVGDVNITVSGADSPKQTARETMALFRREMRRHTSTF